MKKVTVFAAHVIVTALVYTALLYLWYLIDHGIKEFDWSLLVQGLLFSVLFVSFSTWRHKRKK